MTKNSHTRPPKRASSAAREPERAGVESLRSGESGTFDSSSRDTFALPLDESSPRADGGGVGADFDSVHFSNPCGRFANRPFRSERSEAPPDSRPRYVLSPEPESPGR